RDHRSGRPSRAVPAERRRGARDRGHPRRVPDVHEPDRQGRAVARIELEAAGATLADIVKTNTYVTDIEEFFKHVDVRMEYFGALPTSTTVEVRKLAHPDLVVEVEAIAVID
ncbi:MAG: RidA family protein, partial [Candidatus Rokuibacteriota bacterium]